MIYVIKGSEASFIEAKLKELTKGYDNPIKLDGSSKDFSIDEMLESCNTNSLFADKNMVLVKDPYFLIKKVDDKELNNLYAYISSPAYETDLVLYTLEDIFNTKLKAFKQVISNAELISLDILDYKNFNSYCYSRINEEGLKINRNVAYYLTNICKRDASLFNQNLEVLKLYPGNIDETVIDKLCTSSDNNLVYDLINAICAKDINKSIIFERKLLNETDSILGVIALLANSLRQTYYIGYLYDKGYRKAEILNECKISEFIVNKSLDMLNKYDKNAIINLLNDLSELECSCKANYGISDTNKFELFLLKMMENKNYASN